jgi:hypothetical protein
MNMVVSFELKSVYRVGGGLCGPECATLSGVHPHCSLQVVVGFHVVVCVDRLAIDPTLTRDRQNSGSDSAPLSLRQGDGELIKREDVGSDVGLDGHDRFV